MADFATLEPIIRAARERLDQGTWDYLVGGSESETTLRRNRAAFDQIAFRPRILVDVSEIDASTTFLRRRLGCGGRGVRHYTRDQLRHRTRPRSDRESRRWAEDFSDLCPRRHGVGA